MSSNTHTCTARPLSSGGGGVPLSAACPILTTVSSFLGFSHLLGEWASRRTTFTYVRPVPDLLYSTFFCSFGATRWGRRPHLLDRFEPTISAGERPQTYFLDRAVTGTVFPCFSLTKKYCSMYTPMTTYNHRRFKKLRTATFSFIVSVRLSVRMEQLGSHWTDCHYIWYFSIFPTVWKIEIWFHSAIIVGTLHQDICTIMIIFPWILFRIRNISDIICREN